MASQTDIQLLINDIQKGANYPASKMRPLLTQMLDFSSAGQTQVFAGLVANGTTSSTTLVLEVGVNIIETSTSTDLACKLPQPITGQRVVVVNKGDMPIYLFPSNDGGQINNYQIDQPAIIPADGNAYDFICIKNPLPGAWVWTSPAINQLDSGEIDVSHTNGSDTNATGYSTGTLTFSGISAGIDGGGNLDLVGNFKTELSPKRMVRLKCYSNILNSDLAGVHIPDAIVVSIKIAFKSSLSSVVLYTPIEQPLFGNPLFTPPEGVQFAPVGTLNSPSEIGDTDTMYTIYDSPLTDFNSQLGSGGTFSSYYYTFGMIIPASASSKTYKFRFFLEYF